MTKPSVPLGPVRRGAKTAAVPRPPPRDTQGDPPRATDALKDALRDSRHRWRELVMLQADLAFETDRRGRFALLAPDTILGWSADQLLGRPAEILLAEPDASGGFNPFRPIAAARGRRAWLKRSDGSAACLSFSIAPIRDAAGRLLGGRGVALDMSEQDDGDEARAASLRRGEVIDHVLGCIRQEVLAPRMMQAALRALSGAMGAEGAAVFDAPDECAPDGCADGGTPVLRHQFGQLPAGLAERASCLLAAREDAQPAQGVSAEGRRLLACGCETRFGERTALVLWREPGGRSWDGDDVTLVASAAGIARMILEHESIQHEMARQARTDPLTGLLNRRAFTEEVTRRIDRLDRDGVPGTIMFIDLDHFKRVNDLLGHERGDEALCIVAGLLRAAVRPGDLVARFGGDEFTIWFDGVEELSASERAEMLRTEAPAATAYLAAQADGPSPLPQLTLSIGIATRWPGRDETLEALIQRADQVMYDVKRAGRAHWRVSRSEAW